jgi:serine/threonine-protein kinase
MAAREKTMKQKEERNDEQFSRKPDFLPFDIGGMVMILMLVLPILGCAAPAEPTPTEIVQPGPTNTPEPQVVATDTPVETGIGRTEISQIDGMTMFFIPAGEFEMGSEGNDEDEKPVHTVYLDAFWIDQFEVTNALYARCVEAGKCDPPDSSASDARESYYGNPEFANYPVIYVSWNDAVTYCELAERRLPTEAEWEKAASWDEKNQTKNIYPWGESIDCSWANYWNQGSGCVGETTAVGFYESGRSLYGPYDMVGNVWEWTSSLLRPYPYDAADGREEPASLDLRVLRGGSWRNDGSDARSANRFRFDPTNTFPYVGFRCARDATP